MISLWCLAAAPARAESEKVDACVTFEHEAKEKSLLVEATNSCERRFSCRIDYAVICTDLDGKQTRRVAKRAPFALTSKGNAEVVLSAAGCGETWRIDDFTWTCG
jgi:hypothetical protein